MATTDKDAPVFLRLQRRERKFSVSGNQTEFHNFAQQSYLKSALKVLAF
jgi:hypothetical protein